MKRSKCLREIIRNKKRVKKNEQNQPIFNTPVINSVVENDTKIRSLRTLAFSGPVRHRRAFAFSVPVHYRRLIALKEPFSTTETEFFSFLTTREIINNSLYSIRLSA
jgi:hypothetical protein